MSQVHDGGCCRCQWIKKRGSYSDLGIQQQRYIKDIPSSTPSWWKRVNRNTKSSQIAPAWNIYLQWCKHPNNIQNVAGSTSDFVVGSQTFEVPSFEPRITSEIERTRQLCCAFLHRSLWFNSGVIDASEIYVAIVLTFQSSTCRHINWNDQHTR